VRPILPCILNKDLIAKMNVSEVAQKKLCKLYEILDAVLEMAQKDDHPDAMYAHLIETIEFQLQKYWGFPQDSNFHSWWNLVPQCTCPMLDNKDAWGVHKIINGNCPIHGEKSEDIPKEKEESAKD
jgi:hypothetical protein